MSGAVELLAQVEVGQDYAALLAQIEIRGSSSAELLGRVEAQATAELPCNAIIRHVGIPVELLGKAAIRQAGTPVELLGGFVVRHRGAPVEILGQGIIKNIDSAELPGKFITRHSHHAELLARLEVGQGAAGLLVRVEVGQGAEGLLGRAVIRHSAPLDLKFSLYVRPWYLTAAEMVIGGRDRRMRIR